MAIRGAVHFELKSELKVEGAVYALLPFQGMLLGSVNNRVCVWRWASSKLELVCAHTANILALFLQASGDLILVGDLMRSASLLRYCGKDTRLEELARDLASAWLTATAMLSDSVFLCADESHHLLALTRVDAAEGKSSRAFLDRVGHFHVGEFVNRMHRAALVEQPVTEADAAPETNADGLDYTPVSQVVWASVDGAVGIVASLRGEREFARLTLIQEAVSREVPAAGGLPHGEWRDVWEHLGGPAPHRGFIDGDLLEALLALPRAAQERVAERVRAQVPLAGVEELLREVEELARLH